MPSDHIKINDPPKRRDPGESANCTRATRKITTVDSTLFREFVSIAVVGALLAVLFVDSVVGMADDFTSGPIVRVHVAEVTDGR